MIIVYRLRDDTKYNRKYIADVQNATINSEDYGIKQTHGLFCSAEWWNNIDKGSLELQTLKGKITRVYMGSMNDWPEFEITTEDGQKESFTREAETETLDAEYQPGRAIEIYFVWQQHKKSFFGESPDTKIVLEIRIEKNSS